MTFAVGLFLLAAAPSCRLVRAFLPEDQPPPRPFNHQAHLDRGLSCVDCHATAAKEIRAGMPEVSVCMNCHEEIDKEPGRPREATVAWFLDEAGKPQWSAFTKQSEEILFSHESHARLTCVDCHIGIDKDTGLRPAGHLLRMSACAACHERSAPADTGCAVCHLRLDRDVEPANHLALWKKRHGPCAREGTEVSTANDCSMCHANDACAACHQTERPDDHHGAWRFLPHGVAASIDRERCQVCHTSDSCVRCHQETAPRSHAAGWGAPRDRHCVSCHLPLQSSGSCFVCHKSTPGHDTAPAMPAWHNAGMNCRSCHSASLQHPDSGDRCTDCHR